MHSTRIGSKFGFTQLWKVIRRDSRDIDKENVNPKVEMMILE